MSDSEQTDEVQANPEAELTQESWMPMIMAGTVLFGIAFFIFCAVSTWVLFQKRGEMVVRTLDGTFIPEIEQSLLEPDEKTAIVKQLKEFSDEVKRGNVENWQAAGVMQRLVRLPVLQWGELTALTDFVRKQDSDNAANAARQFSRFRRAVEMDQATAIDVEDILRPVMVEDDSVLGRRLSDKLTLETVNDVIARTKLVADRAKVPDKDFENVRIEVILRRQIEAGMKSGTM